MDHEVKSTSAVVAPSLFHADELAPYDYEENCQRKDRYGPEERLLFAILEDAVSCYQVYLFARKEEERLLFVEAEQWIFDDGVEFTSFNSICETLRIDPTYLRRGLCAWRMATGERVPAACVKRAMAHRRPPATAVRIVANGK